MAPPDEQNLFEPGWAPVSLAVRADTPWPSVAVPVVPGYVVDYGELDARYHPGVTTPLPAPAPPAHVYAASAGASLSEAEVDALLERTGWPIEWRADMKTIMWCESRFRPSAIGDGGNSRGLAQLWTGWFAAAGYSLDDWADPDVNSRVALYVRQQRGRFGGGGGWTCADLSNIP